MGFGEQGKTAFISGVHGNKGKDFRETGKQSHYWGTGNTRNTLFALLFSCFPI